MLLDDPDALAALTARGYRRAGPRIALDFDMTGELYRRDPALIQQIGRDSAARFVEQQGAAGKVRPTTVHIDRVTQAGDLVRVRVIVDTDLLDPTWTPPTP